MPRGQRVFPHRPENLCKLIIRCDGRDLAPFQLSDRRDGIYRSLAIAILPSKLTQLDTAGFFERVENVDLGIRQVAKEVHHLFGFRSSNEG